MTLSTELFLVVLVVGAALLALWVYARFPKLSPEGLPRTLLHLVAAYAVLQLVPAATATVSGRLQAVFLIVLPGFIYIFLAAIWTLRLAQSAMGSAR